MPNWNQDYPRAFSGQQGKQVYDFLVGVPKNQQSISNYMPQSFPQRTPQSNPLWFLNDAGQAGPPPRTPGDPSRTPVSSLPTPDFIAGNPGYATQTQSLSQGYNNALGNDVYSRGSTLTPGSAEYQATRQTLGLPAEGSGQMYSRQYMAPGGTASGISGIAPGQGTLSVMNQGNGGTVEGNVAAINRQTAALQDLRQARLDDPNVGRFRFGTDGIRRGVDPLDVASGRTDSLGTLLPDVSRARTSQQLQLAEMAQRALQLQDSATRSGQQLTANTARANTLADLFKQQQQFGLEQQRLGVDQQKINADTALRTSEQQQKWAQNTFENTFLKMPEGDRKMAEADLTNHLMQLYDKGDQEGIKKLMPLASLILRYNPKPEDPLAAYLAQQQR
ncbi:MAG: hypothetical protein E6Q97_01900 [Desulfurellales bacterium]|nr:MAG: hypothetical protein E6Q97_01900 [Desulfurellales bacterium]